jgi:hypothetical protein
MSGFNRRIGLSLIFLLIGGVSACGGGGTSPAISSGETPHVVDRSGTSAGGELPVPTQPVSPVPPPPPLSIEPSPSEPSSGCTSADSAPPVPALRDSDGWVLAKKETFDRPLPPEAPWIEDLYGNPEDPWDEDGAFFFTKYRLLTSGGNFAQELAKFRSFRKSVSYGERGWLTFELYGRDADSDGRLDPVTEHGGEFLIRNENGNCYLELNNKVHYDGAEVRSTDPLPSEYRIRLKVTPISAGGKDKDAAGKEFWGKNGYSDVNESAGPWRFNDQSTTPLEAWKENGFYFLTILDTKPMPHNNVWIHHHRKVVIDSDNNVPGPNGPWSWIWNGQKLINEGSHPVSMLALDGSNFGSVWTGNRFHCFFNGNFSRTCGGHDHAAADAYINGETYQVMIERNATHYVLEISGKFQFGGQKTYRGQIDFRNTPVWHYNNTIQDAPKGKNSQPLKNLGIDWNAWPENSAYPDYFMFGDPHIAHYEGKVRYDDIELWTRP